MFISTISYFGAMLVWILLWCIAGEYIKPFFDDIWQTCKCVKSVPVCKNVCFFACSCLFLGISAVYGVLDDSTCTSRIVLPITGVVFGSLSTLVCLNLKVVSNSVAMNEATNLVVPNPVAGNEATNIVVLNPVHGNEATNLVVSNPVTGNEDTTLVVPNPVAGNEATNLVVPNTVAGNGDTTPGGQANDHDDRCSVSIINETH